MSMIKAVVKPNNIENKDENRIRFPFSHIEVNYVDFLIIYLLTFNDKKKTCGETAPFEVTVFQHRSLNYQST